MGRRVPSRVRELAAAAFWLVAWQLASFTVGDGLILAGPVDVALALARLVPTAAFWGQVGFSTLRIVGGCAAGYLVAGALACASHRWRSVRALLQPALSAVKGTPVACVVVLLLIWVGSRNVSALAVLLMVIPGIYFPVLAGLDSADGQMRELFDVFGVRGLRRALALIWPSVLPLLTAASCTVLGMSWKAGVAAELIGSPAGSIGERIYQAKLLLETSDLFAWTIVVVVLSWVFEHAVLAALRGSWPAAGRTAAHLTRRGKPSPGSTERPVAIRAAKLLIGHGGTPCAGPTSFQLSSDGVLCLRGASGAGKTTLLRTIAGFERPLSGTLSSGNGRMSAVFQESTLIGDLSAIDNVLLFSAPDTSSVEARSLLEELLPSETLDRPMRELSGGQCRRVELARAFAAPANLVLLDEPFTGLDASAHARALAFVRAHRAGRAVIIATHDDSDADELAAAILRL